MTHQALIQALCDDLTPVRTTRVEHHLGRGIAIGGAASLAILVASLGVQPGLDSLPVLAPLAMKLAGSLAVAAMALRAVRELARPVGGAIPLSAPIGLVALMLAGIAIGQLSAAPSQDGVTLWQGASWQSCSLYIAALSLPLMAGIGWALRQQAPVDLRRAGAVAGLAAGSLAAAIYALACSEHSAAFVLLWYSLGIAAATGIGALLGPRFLRW